METFYCVKNGCSKYPDCFTCPFEDCMVSKKDKQDYGARGIMEDKHLEAVGLLKKGHSTKEVAEIIGCNLRTVQRIKSRINII